MKSASYSLTLLLSSLLALPAFAAKPATSLPSQNVNSSISAPVADIIDSVLPDFQLDNNWLDYTVSPVFVTPLPAMPLDPIDQTRANYTELPKYAFGYLNQLNSKVIDGANKTVDVVMYSINIPDNVDDLVEAAARGVKIRVIMNENHVYKNRHKEVKRLIATPGVEFKTLRGTQDWGVNHNKIVISDNKTVTTGSYNWTFSATYSNMENSVVLTDSVYVKGFSEYFEWMWSIARTLDQGPSGVLPQGAYGIAPQAPLISRFNGVDVPAYIFSPGSRSEERLAALIDAAKVSVDAVTFSFSSTILADALTRASQRGVQVRFMMDDGIAKSSYVGKYLFLSGTDFKVRPGRTEKGALHNKFIIIDGKVLQTGSFNWAVNASVNSFENMVFFIDGSYIKAYQNLYNRMYGEAKPVTVEYFSELGN